jgi:type IV pilus assembly protein PilW
MSRQTGFTLIELMIAILISLIVLAGVSSVFLSTILSSREVVAAARLNQEIGLVMDRILSDVRRAGYWGDEVLNVDVGEKLNPFTNSLTRPRVYDYDGLSDNCITYAYNEDSGEDPAKVGVCSSCSLSSVLNDPDVYEVGTIDVRGFRLTSGGVIEELVSLSTGGTASGFSCSSGTWQAFSDGNIVNVTDLTFDLNQEQVVSLALPSGVEYAVKAWTVGVSVNAELTSDSSVKKTLSAEVALPNMEIDDGS